MSLQARLRHTLGERWIELPPRGVDEPLVVGRVATADVQVPSVTVAQKHCVLFVHDGLWVVQDVPGSTGTYVNGAKIEGPTLLQIGDVITLGPDASAPAIDVDPTAAEGRKGQPATATAARVPPSARGIVPEIPAPVGPDYPPAVTAPIYPPTYPPPPQQYGAVYPPGYSSEQPLTGWPSDATPQYYTPRRRKRSFDSGNGVIIGMMLTLFIAAGAGYWLYRRQEGSAQVIQTPPATTPGRVAPPARQARSADDGAAAPPNIFNPGRTATAPSTRVVVRPPARAPTTVAAAVPASPSPVPPPATAPDAMPAPSAPDGTGLSSGTDAAASAEPPASQDAADASAQSGDDEAWKQVLMARQLKDEGKAIVLFDDYARTHPDTHADQIRAFTETMLDRIWFERIDGLCNQREELGKKIQELDKEIAEETDQKYKKTVAAPLRARYVEQLKHIEDELTNTMKYAAKSGPNLLDNAELDKLRQARDPQYYSLWKARILEHVRRTHGELPWATNKSL